MICSGTSDRMLNGLADATLETAKKSYGINGRVEGYPENGWLLVDFGDVIVHLLSPDQRGYYRIEDLWEKGKMLLHLQ